MNQPEFLHKGDAIYMVAPSFGVAGDISPYAIRYKEAKKHFLAKGYRVIEGENIFLEEGVAASSSPEKRAKEIMDAFASEAKLILSVGGGETMVEILPHLDFAFLASKRKWFMGSSDNTNLTLPLALLADTMSIYGPCAPSFYQKKWRNAEIDAIALLEGKKDLQGYPKYSITKSNKDHPLWSYRLTQEKTIRSFHYEAPFSGRILGGCLDCILGLMGTPYADMSAFNARYSSDKVIFALEAYDLNPLSIRRGLFQMKEAGYFTNCAGFLFGRHMCRDLEIFGVNKYNAVSDILGELNVPILMDVDFGHIPPALPFKIGAKAVITLEKGNIYIHYEE